MNRTRIHLAAPLRRLAPALLLLAVVVGIPAAAQADLPGTSPYFGEPILSAEGPAQAGGSVPDQGGAPTLRVGGVGGAGKTADLDPYFEVPGGGIGIEGRIGHIAGEALGREESLTHINLQPYVFVEQNMIFSDLRMYRLNEGGLGGNMGAGWRRYFEGPDAIFGVIGYVDVDDTRPAQFQQTGLSLEMLTRWLDLRANWYLPFGDIEQITGTGFVAGSQKFEGNFLLVDATTDFSSAADGVDFTATVPVPWQALAPYNVEASGGFYHYQVSGSDLPRVWGYSMRADASFFDRILHTFVELTHDRQFDTRVTFGASLDYYGGFQTKSRLTDRQYYRMSEFVRRNYNVVTIDSTVITPDVPVLNPADNQPYFFVHIDNTDGPDLGDGTFENPYDSILTAFDEAEMSPVDEDVFLVHGGSTFTGAEASVKVPEGDIFLGENVPGRPQTLPGVGLGLVELPVANPGAGPVTLENADGSAIDATDALLVGAFTIINPSENGLLISGPSALTTPQLFRDISILGANGDGILFDDASGDFTLNRVTVAAADDIDGAMGAAFHVSGGDAIITALDENNDAETDPTFENSGGNVREVILIENTEGGTVDLTNTSANDHGGAIGMGGGGIRLLNNAGNVAIGSAIIDNTMIVPANGTTPEGVGAGLEIFGGTGNTTIFGDVTITNASGVGFLVDSLMPTGLVNVAAGSTITINDRNTIGADFRNIMGAVNFSPTLTSGSTQGGRLTIGPLNAVTDTLDPAIRFRSSTGSVSLNNVSIANSNSDGILIGGPLLEDQNIVTVDEDGTIVSRPRFVATGTTNINSTGSLTNLGTAAIRIEGAPFDPVTNPFGEGSDVEFRGLTNINTRVDRGIQIVNTSGRILFSGDTIVNNDATVLADRAGLFINNSISTISFGDFTVNDHLAGEPAVEIHNVPRPGAVGFSNLVIADAQGDGLDEPGGDGDLTQGLPEDTTGLLVDRVNVFTITDGTIDVMDGTAVDIQNVYPQIPSPIPGALPLEIVRDNQNRPVVLDPITRLPVAILDANGDPIVDSNGNNIVPSPFNLIAFPGYQVSLTSVNAIATSVATSQQYGIYLMNNTGSFEITGITGVPGSGGEISGSTVAGLFADDADEVTIRNQDYIGNTQGLVFQNMNETSLQGFFLDGLLVQDSALEAVSATDVRNITILNSAFQNNGILDLDPDADGFLFADTISIVVNERPDDPFNSQDEDNPLLFPYTYVIDNNTFLDQTQTFGSDAVHIQTGAGFARGSLLTMFFRGNNFLAFDRSTVINDTPKMLHVEWNGTIDGLVSGNVATVVADNIRPRGFEIRQSSGDDNLSQVVVTNNFLNFNNATQAVGTFFDFVGTARIDATFNEYLMGNGDSTALQFRLLGESNDVEIASNIFDFGLVTNALGVQFGSGVGIDVLQVVGGAFPSSFLINDNFIGRTAQLAADTAVRFQTTIGRINIFGPQQNTVFANNFFLPTNNPDIFGQININGFFLP